MDTKLKNSHRIGIWIIILAVLTASAATIGLYPYIKARASEFSSNKNVQITEQGSDYSGLATQVMNFSYEIWHQQKQEEAGGVLTYSQTFLPGLDETIKTLREEEIESNESVTIEEDYQIQGDGDIYERAVSQALNSMDSMFGLDYYQNLQFVMDNTGKDWERYYQKYSSIISYSVVDDSGRFMRSNVNRPDQVFGSPLKDKEVSFTVEFSPTGSLKVADFEGSDVDGSRLLQAMSRYEFYDPLAVRMSEEYQYGGVQFTGPRDIKIVFRCVPGDLTDSVQYDTDTAMVRSNAILRSGSYHLVAGSVTAVLMVLALALPAFRRFEIGRSALCRLSFEPLSFIGFVWLCIMGEGSIPARLIADSVNGSLKQEIMRAGFLSGSADVIVILMNLLFWAAAYGMFYWGITCYRAFFSIGPWRYFKERTWLGRFLRFIKRWTLNALNVFNETDWESRSTKIIGKAVIGNFIILALISLLWFWGIGALILYSLVLFFLLRKYWGQMQQKYNLLLKGINQMAEGNLDVEIEENLGFFNPFKEQLSRIQEGFKKAVAQEVKSERTKSELITNVSHDLKTPLTAIITYVNLLKQENITEEERASYIQVLDQKSMRLKVLIEDLFEVSKANSGTVTLHPENVDIISLLKQVRFELSDKMDASGIEFRFNLPKGRVVLYLDSQKTYRIFENLLVNIAKYGMPGTRAYIQVMREADGYVNISMRNVSAKELNVSPEDLTERFVRGDSSRNTEGSGLGLAIARSFVEVQGGAMKIEVEDDLFRVIIRWKENEQRNDSSEHEAGKMAGTENMKRPEDSQGMDKGYASEVSQEMDKGRVSEHSQETDNDQVPEDIHETDKSRAPEDSPEEKKGVGNLWSPEENRIITGEWTLDQEDEDSSAGK